MNYSSPVPVVVSAGWESGSFYFSGWELRRRVNFLVMWLDFS